jgi:hypothetical protein
MEDGSVSGPKVGDAYAELASARAELLVLRALVEASAVRCDCGLLATRSEPFHGGRWYCDDCVPPNSNAGAVHYHEAARAMNAWSKEHTVECGEWTTHGRCARRRGHRRMYDGLAPSAREHGAPRG